MLTALKNWAKSTAHAAGGFAAVTLSAIVGRDISHFPLVRQTGSKPRTMHDKDIIKDILATLPAGLADEGPSTALIKHCRESLDEVKALTEYQDQKATRLLTIVAFLSALAGLLFARLSDSYPLLVLLNNGLHPLACTAVVSAYSTFALFVGLAVTGALVIFHATKTVFKYPIANPESADARPSSVLFYAGIVGVTPAQWARNFVVPAAEPVAWRRNLEDEYLRNYVVESYLVAAKAADKIRYLQPGQELLLLAIRMLLLFVLALACVIVSVPPVARENAMPPKTAVNVGLSRSAGTPPPGVVKGDLLPPTHTTAVPSASTEPALTGPAQAGAKKSPLLKKHQTYGKKGQGNLTSGR